MDNIINDAEFTKAQNAKVVMTTVELPGDVFDAAYEMYSADTLAEHGKARDIFHFGGKNYVIISGGMGKITGQEITPAEFWHGETYKYNDLTLVNGSGGLFHSNGEIFSCRGKKWVILPYQGTIFTKGKTVKQLSLI